MKMRGAFLSGAVTVALAGSGTACAPTASAGCEGPPLAQVCDGPVTPDGSWQRCMTAYGGPIYTNPVGSYFPNTWKCFRAQPDDLPSDQPQYHIDS